MPILADKAIFRALDSRILDSDFCHFSIIFDHINSEEAHLNLTIENVHEAFPEKRIEKGSEIEHRRRCRNINGLLRKKLPCRASKLAKTSPFAIIKGVPLDSTTFIKDRHMKQFQTLIQKIFILIYF